MYPEGTTRIYSNLTPRRSRLKGCNEIVVFGIQYFIIEYLIKQWNDNFFHISSRNEMSDERWNEYISDIKSTVIKKYKRLMDNTLGKDAVNMEHIEKLWDLGYMPLKIKALAEGEQMRPH